jgi:hypothetical protein
MANSISERVIEEKVLNGINAQGVIELTQKLIQFSTINPPADYSEIAPYLCELLTSLGMETHIMDGHPGKKNVFGIWRGSAKEGALLLNGHTDVVPARDPKMWDHDLFGGGIYDGWLWGRGCGAPMAGSSQRRQVSYSTALTRGQLYNSTDIKYLCLIILMY